MNTFKYIFFVINIALITSCLSTSNNKFLLNASDFYKKINKNDSIQIIDVRTAEEFSKGHIENAINIDWNANDFENLLLTINKNTPTYVYCLSGGRSSKASNKMREIGFAKVLELNGGIIKWRAENLPETTEKINLKAGLTKHQFTTITNSNKIVLIDFYADWCEPCKKMKPYLEEIQTDLKDKLLVLRINVDDNQNLCKELKIDALPVLQIYKNKNLVWNNVGFIEKDAVLKEINK